jgi:holliday junction DNA helicase RuvA
MIGKLTGIIDEAGEDFAVIDVGGVGYVVHCSARVLSNLPAAGQRTTLYVETQMREDSIKLFGFTSSEEREWFRLLQTVQGVGAKVALSLLSSQTTHELGKAIAFGDKAQIGRAQGVGPKLAARIAAELKDKAVTLSVSGSRDMPGGPAIGVVPVAGAASEAVSALVNLGYSQTQAATAVATVVAREGEAMLLPQLIRESLRALSSAA